MKRVIGITGTPGSGKKTIAPKIASLLGFTSLDLNTLASTRRGASHETVEVDVKTLRSRIAKKSFENTVIFGHLLPDVFTKKDLEFVAVLRCNPRVLKRRLIQRGYPAEKLRENLEAELIGVSLAESINSFGESKVHEYSTDSSRPWRVARQIASDFLSGSSGRRERIDWTLLYNSPARLISLFSTASTESALT